MKMKSYRGLDLLTNDWVYGELKKTKSGKAYIIVEEDDSVATVEVDDYTVGELVYSSTGISVYDGDIIQLDINSKDNFGVVYGHSVLYQKNNLSIESAVRIGFSIVGNVHTAV